ARRSFRVAWSVGWWFVCRWRCCCWCGQGWWLGGVLVAGGCGPDVPVAVALQGPVGFVLESVVPPAETGEGTRGGGAVGVRGGVGGGGGGWGPGCSRGSGMLGLGRGGGPPTRLAAGTWSARSPTTARTVGRCPTAATCRYRLVPGPAARGSVRIRRVLRVVRP